MFSKEKFPTKKVKRTRKVIGVVSVDNGVKTLQCSHREPMQLQDIPQGSEISFIEEYEEEIEVIPENRKCEHCGGEGWLWRHELKRYYGDWNCSDDTRYTCDYCDGSGLKPIDE